MATFDPYRKWLGIPPGEQPPNHYRLLGVGLFESDPDVISSAADRQMVHVRTFQSGKHSELSQQILNELAAARLCLLDARKKAEYDDQLRRQLPGQTTGPPPPQIVTPPQPPPGSSAPPVSAPLAAPPVTGGPAPISGGTRPGRYSTRRKPPSLWVSVIALAVVFVSLALLAWALNGSDSDQPGKPGLSNGGHNGNGSSRRQTPPGQSRRPNRRRAGDDRRPPRRPSRGPQGSDQTNQPGNGSAAPSGVANPADGSPGAESAPESSPITTAQLDPQAKRANDQELEFERTPVPDAASQQQIEKLIRNGDLQKDFGAADTPQGKLALARKLLAEAVKPQDDVGSAYVLLRLARDEAAGLGDAGTALAAVEEIGKRYEIDLLGQKVETLEAASQVKSASADNRTLVEKALGVIDEAAAADDFQAADRLLKIARPAASKVREGVLSEGVLSKLVKTHAKRIETLKENHQPGQPDPKELPSQPDGPGEVFDPRVLPVFGSSDASEAAVDRALEWLAEHQKADGSWSFDHTGPPCKKRCPNPGSLAAAPNAATALALLPFLAAGNGPRQGKHRENVAGGLDFLKSQMRPLGPTLAALYEPRARQMPSHALGTIALCEASAVSPDRHTRKAAQSAVNCIVLTQNADGGWPAQPQRPNQQPGPSSLDPTGWNLAALKTAQWAGLQVPKKTLKQARAYLDGMRTEDKTGYRPNEDSAQPDPTATAIAVLSQMYLGWPHQEPELVDYVAGLGKSGPSTTGQFYLNYHNCQVMRHHGGPSWNAWNTALRDHLVATQAGEGHAAGSWYRRRPHWGTRQGGRLFCTALGALILEVYYRHPPLYD